MKVKPEDQQAFIQMFDIGVKYLLHDIYEYRKILLDQCEKSQNKNVDFDRQFMIDLAEEGFIRSVENHIKECRQDFELKKSISDQVHKWLNEDDQ